MLDEFRKLAKELPEKPGIYRFFKDDELLYIGKANSLKHRVSSYLLKAHNQMLEAMLGDVNRIEHVVTDSSVEALILEAQEIQAKQPPLNVKLKDDKSFLGVYITKEDFPRIFPARLSRKSLPEGTFYGPYTSAKTLRQALKIIRKIFGYCDNPELRKTGRPCFYYHIGQCPGVCTGEINEKDYAKQIHHLVLFLTGHKKQLLQGLRIEMNKASKAQDYERASLYKRQLDALKTIHDAKFELPDLGPKIGSNEIRIEGYDIANISGKYASASMVVSECIGGQCRINTNEYRRFSIKDLDEPNDIGMMEEVLVRRLKHDDWTQPNIIQVDGGATHVAMAKRVVKAFRKPILVVGMAKGVLRKRSDLYGDVSTVLALVTLEDLIVIRDESHRFANAGYKKRHRNSFLK